ncbi:MAG: PilW family protein [Candidatus Thiodiazotropha sp.]
MIRSTRKQAGLSIISLMIASAIGVFLIGGAGKIYLDSKNAFIARSTIAAAAESSRFAVQDLRRNLVMAGRGVTEQNDNPSTYLDPDNNMRTFPAVDPDNTVAASSTGIIDMDSNDSSAVAVRYAEGPAPCGQDGTIDTTHTVRFYRNGDAELICQSIETVAGALNTGGAFERAMASGVVLMRALYGVDTDADGIANQYLTATEVDNADRWVNVVTIRIGIVTSSDTEELPYTYRPAAAEEMRVLGMEHIAADTSHSFKTASTTIALRNLNTTVQRQ